MERQNNVSISITNADGVYVASNQAHRDIYRRPRDGVVGHHWSEFVDPSDLPHFMSVFQHVLETGAPQRVCREVPLLTGEPLFVAGTVVRVSGRKGVHVVASVRKTTLELAPSIMRPAPFDIASYIAEVSTCLRDVAETCAGLDRLAEELSAVVAQAHTLMKRTS